MNKRIKNSTSALSYDELELRQVLSTVNCTLIEGTDANDILRVQFVDDPAFVRVSLNDQPFQMIGLDSEAATIDLGAGIDRVIFDDAFEQFASLPQIDLESTEQIEAAQGNNRWDLFAGIEGGIDGQLNDSVSFSRATFISGGIGMDVFRVNTFANGTLFGNAGDDVFVFGSQLAANSGTAWGGEGDDRFVVRGSHLLEIHGQSDTDRLTFRQSELSKLSIHLNTLGDFAWFTNDQLVDVDRILGLKDGLNQIETDIDIGEPSRDLVFVLNGRFTRVSGDEILSTAFVDFSDFELSAGVNDIFYIRATAFDVQISGADYVQLSSELIVENGNLDSISHNITLVAPTAAGFSIDPQVVISHQSGSQGRFTLDRDTGVLDWGNTGSLTVTEVVVGEFVTHVPYDLTVYGTTDGDRFLVVGRANETPSEQNLFFETLRRIQFKGLEGNDRFLVGGTANDNSNPFAGRLEIEGGTGEDMIFVNDRGATTENYQINQATIRTDSFLVIMSDPIERVRLEASQNSINKISAIPSTVSRFVINANPSTENQLTFVDSFQPGQIVARPDGTFAWRSPLRNNIGFSSAIGEVSDVVSIYAGRSLNEAIAIADENGVRHRTFFLNGEPQGFSSDFDENRVTFVVIDNVVVSANLESGGAV